MRGAIATVAIAERLCDGPVHNGVDRESLRRAAEAALTTRVDLRDDIDADFQTALDDLLEVVIDRGEDPDIALAEAKPPKD